MKKSLLFALGIIAVSPVFTSCDDDDDDNDEQILITTFEDAEIDAAQGYINSSAYTYEGVEFNNNYNADWASWSGFAISQLTDTVTAGYSNQYSVFGNGGCNGSKNFAVVYDAFDYGKPIISTTDGSLITPAYAYFQLTTYSLLALRDGNDGYYGDAVKLTSEKANYFNVTLDGYVADQKTKSIVVTLGDYSNGQTFLMNTWTKVDLRSLGNVDKITLTVGGSEDLYGDYGFNAPAYVAIDDFAFSKVSE